MTRLRSATAALIPASVITWSVITGSVITGSVIAGSVIAASALVTEPALAANMCQTEHMTCATTMPVDGYCVCHAQSATEDGTVVPPGVSHGKVNSTAGGCGAAPGSPGCR